MSNALNRTLLAGVVACLFGAGATIAAAQGATSPSTGGDTTNATTTAGTSTAGTDSTTSATGTSNPSTAQSTAGATSGDNPARRVFDQLDTNKDGMLSFDEFSRAVIQQRSQ